MKPPQDRTDWIMLLVVGAVALFTELLKVAAKGGPWHPAGLIVQYIARATLTGVVASAAWSALIIRYELAPTTAVAVAVVVAMLGVDVMERLLYLYAQKRLGLDPDKEAKP